MPKTATNKLSMFESSFGLELLGLEVVKTFVCTASVLVVLEVVAATEAGLVIVAPKLLVLLTPRPGMVRPTPPPPPPPPATILPPLSTSPILEQYPSMPAMSEYALGAAVDAKLAHVCTGPSKPFGDHFVLL